MTASSSSKTLALVVLILVIIHIIVSLSFTIASFNTTTNIKSSFYTWNGIFWLISFFVCIVLFVLATTLYKLQKEISETPCPVQISNPGDSSIVRNSIQNAISLIKNYNGDKTLPPGVTIQPYDPNAAYLVITGKYLTGLTSSRISTQIPLDLIESLFQQYPYIPVATLSDAKIYGLTGREVWPDLNM